MIQFLLGQRDQVSQKEMTSQKQKDDMLPGFQPCY